MASGDPFGTQVKRARERRHLTQQELADLLGVDRKTVDNWEHSRTYPRNRVGALEQWAPELAEDADPRLAELTEHVDWLYEKGLMSAKRRADVLDDYHAQHRARGDGVAERAG